MKTTEKCATCLGCGKVSDGDDRDPWTFWEELPPPANIAVVMGIVKPMECPDCGGSGVARGEVQR